MIEVVNPQSINRDDPHQTPSLEEEDMFTIRNTCSNAARTPTLGGRSLNEEDEEEEDEFDSQYLRQAEEEEDVQEDEE